MFGFLMLLENWLLCHLHAKPRPSFAQFVENIDWILVLKCAVERTVSKLRTWHKISNGNDNGVCNLSLHSCVLFQTHSSHRCFCDWSILGGIPPAIILGPQKHVLYEEGARILMECVATGNPKPRLVLHILQIASNSLISFEHRSVKIMLILIYLHILTEAT